MLTKKGKSFIDIREKSPMPEQPSVASVPERRGPTVYISDVSLPLNEEDIGKIVIAKVQVRLRHLSTRTDEHKTNKSYDLEIVGINFGE